MIEKIKELKALRAELGEADVEEKQAYTEAIISLIKQMGAETVAKDNPIQATDFLRKLTSTIVQPPSVPKKSEDFEFKETDLPEDRISQLSNKLKYIPQ